MKKKIFALFAIVAVFGLAIAAYAYTTASTGTETKASCCKKSDSCPMKDHGTEHAKMEGKSCCDNCCGDSCPMKETGGATAAAGAGESKNCCNNCDCCKGKHETAA